MWLSPLSVLANKRQAVWESDLKAVRGGSSIGQTGLLLGDPLFSKELENMGKQLAGRRNFCVVSMSVLCTCLYAYLQTSFIIIRMGKSDQMLSLEYKAHTHMHVATHTLSNTLTLNYRGLWNSKEFS